MDFAEKMSGNSVKRLLRTENVSVSSVKQKTPCSLTGKEDRRLLSRNSWTGFCGGSDYKESVCNAGDLNSIPGSGRFPRRRKWQPTPVFLPGKSHGQRSLAGYSPWGHERVGHDCLSTTMICRQDLWWPLLLSSSPYNVLLLNIKSSVNIKTVGNG